MIESSRFAYVVTPRPVEAESRPARRRKEEPQQLFFQCSFGHDESELKLDETVERWAETERFRSSESKISPAIFEQIREKYPEIEVSDVMKACFNLQAMDAEQRKNFLSDFMLAFSQPGSHDHDLFRPVNRLECVADDNFSSHLVNFVPKHETQEEALRLANRFLEYEENSPLTFFVHGENGTGKTHLAAALAKKYIQAGLKVYYVSAVDQDLSEKGLDRQRLSQADVVVLDDLNSCERIQDEVREVIYACHDDSKRLIITSNHSPETLIKHVAPEDSPEHQRFTGRFSPYLVSTEVELAPEEQPRLQRAAAISNFFAAGG